MLEQLADHLTHFRIDLLLLELFVHFPAAQQSTVWVWSEGRGGEGRGGEGSEGGRVGGRCVMEGGGRVEVLSPLGRQLCTRELT